MARAGDDSSYASDPDVELMLRFQRDGDEEAFTRLIERHRRAVIGIVYGYLGSAADVEDIAQEAFLRVYRARRRYKPRAKFKTWLFRIVVNLCLNEIRRRRTHGEIPIEASRADGSEESYDVLEAAGIANRDTPAAAFARREAIERLRAALDELGDKQRAAILLAQQPDLSYKEIAAILSTTVTAIKLRVHRARQTLRHRLADLLEETPGAEEQEP